MGGLGLVEVEVELEPDVQFSRFEGLRVFRVSWAMTSWERKKAGIDDFIPRFSRQV